MYKLIENWAPVVYINLRTGKFHFFTGEGLSKDDYDVPEDAFHALKEWILKPKGE